MDTYAYCFISGSVILSGPSASLTAKSGHQDICRFLKWEMIMVFNVTFNNISVISWR